MSDEIRYEIRNRENLHLYRVALDVQRQRIEDLIGKSYKLGGTVEGKKSLFTPLAAESARLLEESKAVTAILKSRED